LAGNRLAEGKKFMKTQRVSLALIIVNLVLLGLQFAHGSPNRLKPSVAPLIRTQALELVDAQGRVRAELRVTPAQPDLKMPDGSTGYPEAVLLRLISSENKPNVKLVTTEDGAGLVLGGENGHVQALSRGGDSFVKIVMGDGRERTIRP
jgi:hypothetical protein